MVLQRLKSANFLSHSEFLAFANEYYIEISELRGNGKPELIEQISDELPGFVQQYRYFMGLFLAVVPCELK